MDPVVRAVDIGFGNTSHVTASSQAGGQVKCAHFPSVAYATDHDAAPDPTRRRLSSPRRIQELGFGPTEALIGAARRHASASIARSTSSVIPTASGFCISPN